MPLSKEAVTAAEIIRNFGFWQQQALVKPVTITHHGRARVMLISTDEYERLTTAASSQPSALEPEPFISGPLHSVLDHTVEGFAVFDRDLRVVYMNRVAEAFYGIEHQVLRGTTVASHFPQSSESVANEWIRRVQRTGEIAIFDMESSIFPDRKLSIRVFPFRDMTAMLFLNVTEQERLKEEAVEWRAAQQAIQQLGVVSLIKLDARGKLAFADEQFTRLTGFASSDLAAARIFDIVTPGSRRRLQAAFEDTIANRTASVIDVDIMVKNGDERRLVAAMAPVTKDVMPHAVTMMMTPREFQTSASGGAKTA